MAYNALDIAKFVISYCSDKGHPINNLKLQEILYFAWVDYYKKTQRPLYNDHICAWQTGPVVPEVYYKFCSFAATPITKTYDSELRSEDIPIMEKIVSRYINVSVHSLVSMTHKSGGPWDVTYCGGAGKRDVIPFALIEKLEYDSRR